MTQPSNIELPSLQQQLPLQNIQEYNNALQSKPIIKGILQTGSKQAFSKNKRISWGNAQVKEYAAYEIPIKDNEIHINLGNIEEESSSKEMSSSNNSSNYIQTMSTTNKQNKEHNYETNNTKYNNYSRITRDFKSLLKNDSLSNIDDNNNSNSNNTNNIVSDNCERGSVKNTHNNNNNTRCTLNIKDILKAQMQLEYDNENINTETQVNADTNVNTTTQHNKSKRYTISLKEALSKYMDDSVNEEQLDEMDKENNYPSPKTTFNNSSSNSNNNNPTTTNINPFINNNNNTSYKPTTQQIPSTPKSTQHISTTHNDFYIQEPSSPLTKTASKTHLQNQHQRITLSINDLLSRTNSYSKSHKPIDNKLILQSPHIINKYNKFQYNNSNQDTQTNTTVDNSEFTSQKYYKSLQEQNTMLLNSISQIKQEIEIANAKKKEYDQEHKQLSPTIDNLSSQLTSLNKENTITSITNQINKILNSYFGIHISNYIILNEMNHKFDLYILHKIKLTFIINANSFITTSSMNDNIMLINLQTQIIPSLHITECALVNESAHKVISNTYQMIIENVFQEKMNIKMFKDNIKHTLRISASYLNMINYLNEIFLIYPDTSIKYDNDKQLMRVFFCICNENGIDINFLFDIKVFNSFLGVYLTDYEIMERNEYDNYEDIKVNICNMINDVKLCLQMKNTSQIMYKDFFIELYDKLSKCN